MDIFSIVILTLAAPVIIYLAGVALGFWA